MHLNTISTPNHLFMEHKKCKVDCKILKTILKRSVCKQVNYLQYPALLVSDDKHGATLTKTSHSYVCLIGFYISQHLITTLDKIRLYCITEYHVLLTSTPLLLKP